ncbi:NUDIX hydrolase [Streptomyces sp. NPDC059009]|uniref:NUDIX hydrolase n=1 Tax=Streptomyces sp. NPDC059009 TaxID=3346694 RepID=UPI0036C0A4FE
MSDESRPPPHAPCRYRLIADVVQVLLRPNGFALCVRRTATSPVAPLQLTLVGGHLEPGEPLDQAARREAREETGVHVDASHQEFRGLVHYNDPLGEDRITEGPSYLALNWPSCDEEGVS